MRMFTLLVCLLLLWPAPQAQQEEVYIIQRNERGDIHLVVGFQGFTHSPRVEVINGKLGTVSIAGAQGQFHGAIAVRLDLCGGRLLLDGQLVAEQQCLRFPVAAKR